MPNIKSQIKRVQISAAENARNTAKKTKVKNAVKKFNVAVEAADIAAAEIAFRTAVSEIDSARIDGIYHTNSAARKVASLSKALDAAKKAAPAAETKIEEVAVEAAPVVKEEKPKRASRKKAEKTE